MGTSKIKATPARRGTVVTSVSLPPKLLEQLKGCVAVGEYRSASDGITHALRLLFKESK